MVDHAYSSLDTKCLVFHGADAEAVRAHVLALARAIVGGGDDSLDLVVIDAREKGAIEIVREALARLSRRAAGARALVVLDADRLTASGVNALLKTIEEPDADTRVLVSTRNPGRLPATIRSRAGLVRVAGETQELAPDAPAFARRLCRDNGALARAFTEHGIIAFDTALATGTPAFDAALLEDPDALAVYLRDAFVDAMTGPGPDSSALAARLARHTPSVLDRRLSSLLALLSDHVVARLDRGQTLARLRTLLG